MTDFVSHTLGDPDYLAELEAESNGWNDEPDTPPYPLLTEAGLLEKDGFLGRPDLTAIESHIASLIAERSEWMERWGEAQDTITRLAQELEEAREAKRQSVEAWNYAQTQNQQMREALEALAKYGKTDFPLVGHGSNPVAHIALAALNPSPSTEGGTE